MFGIFKRVADLERRVKVLQDGLFQAEDILDDVCEIILVTSVPKENAVKLPKNFGKLEAEKKKRGRPRKTK